MVHTMFCLNDLWQLSKCFPVGLHQTYQKAQSLNLPLSQLYCQTSPCESLFSFCQCVFVHGLVNHLVN